MNENPVSDSLRKMIEESGITPYEIANRASVGRTFSVTPQQIYKFMKGQRGLSMSTIDAIAHVLNLELEIKTESD